MNDLTDIKQELISASYPELRNVFIDTKYFKSKDAYFEFTRNSRYSYLIEVDKSMKHVDRLIVVGGLAHELSHISKEIKLNFLLSSLEYVIFKISPRYETYDERKTDEDVVKRGYLVELLKFTKYANRGREHYNDSDGLTVKELKKILKNQ
ncbi:MAG: hypothetical protein ACP5N2_06160 [Candidatus Nanoarchaeia archaeon]